MITLSAQIKIYDWWIVAYLPQDFGRYYRSLCPKAWCIKPPMYNSHITVVRKDLEQLDKSKLSDIEDGRVVSLSYSPEIKTDGLYYWMDVYSPEIVEIRRSLGLPDYRDGYDCYHVTIGNKKDY